MSCKTAKARYQAWDDEPVRHRYLAAGAALWAAAYACGYVAVIRDQGDAPVAWWYVGLVLLAAVALSASAAGIERRATAITGFVMLVIAALLGALSIGIFMLPGALAAGFAVSRDQRAQAPT